MKLSVKMIVVCLLAALPLLASAQNTTYVSIGTSRQVTQVNTAITTPGTLIGAPDQAIYDTTYAACMNPTPPAVSPGTMMCQISANQAQVTDLTKRAETVIQALYDLNPTAADAVLLQNKLLLIKR